MELLLVPLDSMQEMSNPNAVLCNTCENTLSKIHNFGMKISRMKQEVQEKISTLKTRKRLDSSPTTSQRKQICLESPDRSEGASLVQEVGTVEESMEESPQVEVRS